MIALRSFAQRKRHRSAVALLLILVGLLVVWEHAGEPEPHMGDIGSICMAVLSGLSLAAVAGGEALFRRSRPRPVRIVRPLTTLFDAPAPIPAARAGPPGLQVLRR